MKNKHMNLLESFIIDVPVNLCDTVSKKKFRNSKLPLSYYNDLRFLCDLYSLKLHISPTYSHNMYSDSPVNSIYLNVDYRSLQKIDAVVCTTFTHELAHHMQWMAYKLTNDCNFIYTDYESGLKFERQADMLAYTLYKRYFGRSERLARFSIEDFNYPTTKSHIAWYKKWFDKHIADLDK